MKKLFLLFICVVISTALVVLMAPLNAWPHGFAGKRFFPTTLAVEDPFVSDELSLLLSNIKKPGGEETLPTVTTAIAGEYSKRITPRFGLSIGGQYLFLDPDGGEKNDGFGNIEIGAKYQFFTSDRHETVLSLGIEREFGNTGAEKVGAESYSVISPVLFFGQGLVDLPESMRYLRPLALTGVIAAEIPEESSTVSNGDIEQNPVNLKWGFTLQYNIHYLQSFVKDVGLHKPFNHLIPVVEIALNTCLNRGCGGEITGTVNPGVIWFGKSVQIGIEAQIPVNSRTGRNVGVLALVHFFIDDLFPNTPGRPILGSN